MGKREGHWFEVSEGNQPPLCLGCQVPPLAGGAGGICDDRSVWFWLGGLMCSSVVGLGVRESSRGVWPSG